ncbi:MAG: hypothetical protein WCT31_04870 [Candidatus Micrarchaeia archaeon]|jgi:hypothetical protein
MGLIRLIGNRDIEITVGQGKPGPKTLGLQRDKDNIHNAGFGYPINIALTPKFLQRRLLESDITSRDDSGVAQKKLEATPFTESERREIARALVEFPKEARTRLIVRSDESEDGTGIMRSNTIFFDEGASNMEKLVLQIEKEIAYLLAAESTNKARLYRALAGLTENMGVSIMPVYGEQFFDHDITRRSILSPVYGLEYLGPYNGRSLLSIFSSIFVAEDISMIFPDGTEQHLNHRSLRRRVCKINGNPPYPRVRRTEIEKINRLTRLTGPRYLELVKDEWGSPNFVVVQSAIFSPPNIEKPNKAHWKTDLQSPFAFGIASAFTHEVAYQNFTITKYGQSFSRLRNYDSNHRGYLLIVEGNTAGVLLDMLYNQFSIVNAGAVIVIDSRASRAGRFSHLGGFFRALGIPIIITDQPPSFMKELRKHREMELDCALYANQFEKCGIVATPR